MAVTVARIFLRSRPAAFQGRRRDRVRNAPPPMAAGETDGAPTAKDHCWRAGSAVVNCLQGVCDQLVT